MIPLFFIGNKRSGTSLLVRILNRHPKIFVSHESDIAWILYHMKTCNMEVPVHENDLDPSGMRYTIKRYGDLILDMVVRNHPVPVIFDVIQKDLMVNGSPWVGKMFKSDLKVLGDKQPNTSTDVMPFLRQHFPEAKYITCIRHPGDWVESAKRFKKKLNYGPKRSDMLKWWILYEELVSEFENIVPILRVKYRNLCDNPQRELDRVCEFLGVEKCTVSNIEKTKAKVYSKRKVKLTPDAMNIIRRYGLE